MFGQEVPLYDKSLLVNSTCNRAVCDLLGLLHQGFSITDAELERTSGERHGAIRIGKPIEYRWICRFFACFAMEPHNFYDMTSVGAKSQPIVATAFRAVHRPEHRVFTSLLLTDCFDPETKARVEGLLQPREVFSASARSLVERCERDGGLTWEDAEALIREGTERIFRWTGQARDHALYTHLCHAGFKIAADIACFDSHHLNHLTPNTLCMDLYTAAMKFCLGELPEAELRRRASRALGRLTAQADGDWMRLHFKHLSSERVMALRPGGPRGEEVASLIERLTDGLVARLLQSDLRLAELKHSGSKDYTEGPPADTPGLLRQDAYKALSEPVVFRESDGSTRAAVHTARFGEIEQRFYAMTSAGRELYDRCLASADAERDRDPGIVHRDFAAYERMYAAHFIAFPKTLRELLRRGLVHGRWAATSIGRAAGEAGRLSTTDRFELLDLGYLDVEGLRYEDFLPVSAAGIFASNLNQYGTKSTATVKPTCTQGMLEEILGKPILDASAIDRGTEAASLLEAFAELGVLDRLPASERHALDRAVSACPTGSASVGGSVGASVGSGVRATAPPMPLGSL